MTWRLLALPPLPKDLLEVLVGDPRMEIVVPESREQAAARCTEARGSAERSPYSPHCVARTSSSRTAMSPVQKK